MTVSPIRSAGPGTSALGRARACFLSGHLVRGWEERFVSDRTAQVGGSCASVLRGVKDGEGVVKDAYSRTLGMGRGEALTWM